eukprot:gnl/TRDRNA2_/TRDRNA2_76432_c0_seq1.p1 gnl/TRDRNA2_/TRDRNA2_76432_c0~~gnl/TRDRNA2_/TRDRNA2_76432_c0_seq1.p1  ORF type:complete len:206 (+),score=19.14 gnl/TRDRNA2_/TRDRNA2_76432_c0_seq1:31-648(+)
MGWVTILCCIGCAGCLRACGNCYTEHMQQIDPRKQLCNPPFLGAVRPWLIFKSHNQKDKGEYAVCGFVSDANLHCVLVLLLLGAIMAWIAAVLSAKDLEVSSIRVALTLWAWVYVEVAPLSQRRVHLRNAYSSLKMVVLAVCGAGLVLTMQFQMFGILALTCGAHLVFDSLLSKTFGGSAREDGTSVMAQIVFPVALLGAWLLAQ